MFRRTYLWFHEGHVYTAAGRVLDTYTNLTHAVAQYRTHDGSLICRYGRPPV